MKINLEKYPNENILATIVLAVALSPIIDYNVYKYRCK